MNKNKRFLGGTLLLLTAALSTACQQPSAAVKSPAPASPLPAVSSVSADAPTAAPAQNPEDAMPRISVQDAKAAFEKGEAVIIDVRGPDAYNNNHIKGALDHGLGRLEQGDFKDLPKDKRIIAYCSCPTEHSSARAAFVLQKAGFNDAAALVGGNMAWEAAGYAMVKAPPPPPSNPASTAFPTTKTPPAKPAPKAKPEKK